jgi:hypothetical protein
MPADADAPAIGPRLIEIVVDCEYPPRLARFWSALLGIGIKGEVHEGPVWFVALLPICEGGPIIAFQRVLEKKVSKNRIHLDMRVAALDEPSRRVMDLGGRQLAEHDERGRRWRVMADPEGNEFCLTL